MTQLSDVLKSCDMLLIDGLHAFDFSSDGGGLVVECMDGRARKRWQFSAAQVEAAVQQGGEWQVSDDAGEHRLVCMSALRASEEEVDDETPDDTAER